MYKIGEFIVPSHGSWVHPVTGVKYPGNWLSLSSAEDKAAAGIVCEGDVDLESDKLFKLAEIDSRTRTLLDGGFPFKDTWFSMSPAAQSNWTLLACYRAGGPVRFPVTVPTKDDGTFTFNNEQEVKDFVEVFYGFVFGDGSPLATGCELKGRVKAAKTPEALAAIVDNRA